MTHPAGFDPATTHYWFGPEVEGQLALSRVQTAFLRGPVGAVAVTDIVERAAHIFLVEEFDSWAWFEHDVLPRLDPRLPLTVGRYASEHAVAAVLQLPFAARLRIIVRVFNAPWFRLLRPQDEISVGVSYDLISLPVSAGVRTCPADYKDDGL